MRVLPLSSQLKKDSREASCIRSEKKIQNFLEFEGLGISFSDLDWGRNFWLADRGQDGASTVALKPDGRARARQRRARAHSMPQSVVSRPRSASKNNGLHNICEQTTYRQPATILPAMERLPSDLVACILLKLAVQDPLSLLRATCACKSWLRLVEENIDIWKAAFLVPATLTCEQGEETGGALNEYKNIAGLDAEVASLGGYAQLALVRSRHVRKLKKPGWFDLEQK